MNNVVGSGAPAWFRIVAVIGLLWNAVGVAMYLRSVGLLGDQFSGMSAAERTLAESVPGWVTGTFALAVFSGLLGALALVLLKRAARPLLILSLLCVLVQSAWIVAISNAREVHGAAGLAMPAVLCIVAIFLAALANAAAKKGWLR